MAFIGDKAYCEKCNSTGIIVDGAGVDNNLRMIDLENGGRRQAVSGDYVRCKCPEHPRIIARFGRSWFMEDGGGASAVAGTQMGIAGSVSPIDYDEKFQLLDTHTGEPLANAEYAIERANGDVEHGVTNANGYTHRLSMTDSAEEINIYCNGAEHV